MWYLSKHCFLALKYKSIHKNKKKNKNSTHSKIKFCIISIHFFSMMDIKILTTAVEDAVGRGDFFLTE